MVEHELPKLGARVRFPSPAPRVVLAGTRDPAQRLGIRGSDSRHPLVTSGPIAMGMGDIYHPRSMIFSDRSIREAIESGSIIIDPYEAAFVQPSSVDLRVGDRFRIFVNHRYSEIDPRSPQDDLTQLVEMGEDEPFMLHPGEFVLGSTLERVKLGNDVVARLEGKSSLGRLGLLIHSTAGFIDPGFEGHITLELSNVATLPIAIYPDMKIGQISFYQMTTAAEFPYGSPELGSKYQGQSGPTASRSHRDFKSTQT